MIDTKKTEVTATDRKLYEMITENTGIHGMDSGGSSGRHWQRNGLLSLEDFVNGPEGFHDYDPNPEFRSLSVSTFHYLRKHLTYTEFTAALTKEFREWIDTTPKGDHYYNTGYSVDYWIRNVEDQWPGNEWLAQYGVNVDYPLNEYLTYNYDNQLDQDFVHLDIGNVENFQPIIVALSTHNGADIRGGYSDFVFFEAKHGYWSNGIQDIEVECPKCHEHGSIAGMVDEFWQYLEGPFLNITKGCPNGCDTPLTVFTADMNDI